MIDSLQIAGVATYGLTAETLSGLSKFNFIYGSNGSGKTTISRVIANEGVYPTCRVAWKGGAKLEAMVYNRDFVHRNFNASSDLKGIFTLGAKNVEASQMIAVAKQELDALTKSIENLSRALSGEDGLGGKQGELSALEEGFKQICWRQKQKHDEKFATAFDGVRGSSEKFKAKVLQERASNTAVLSPLAALEARALTVFGDAPVAEPSVPPISFEVLIAHEANPVLGKRVLGKGDVDIAAMILKLGNSDWVKEGRSFLAANDSTCPFCQQRTTEAFARSLGEYFDEAFLADSQAIETLWSAYAIDAQRVLRQLASLIVNPSRFINAEALKQEKELLDARLALNSQRLALKKREPSQLVELEALSNVSASVAGLVDAANALIGAHNKTVANLAAEKRVLTAQVWRHVLEAELKAELADYDSKKLALTKAIESIGNNVRKAKTDKEAKASEIRTLEKDATSIQPTIDSINGILASFGFRGFSLAQAPDGANYTLRRADGSDASDTLSEGEKSFVTFLYFYHLLKGSDTEAGMTMNRIVVFDDPVSSLDSDILFIVGSLIKGLFDEVREDRTHIKQVFVLTHNVYFHKEVTFNPKRSDTKAMNEETFWVVRKSHPYSKIEPHASNPVRTSYELLWSEVRKPDRSNLAIQNTLRRILESYFKILGRIDTDEICAMFDGADKLACKSLFSWLNDGSHFAQDDLYVAVDDSMVERYLRVFRGIFVKSGHLGHYKMMMGDAFVGEELHLPVQEEAASA